MKKALVVYYSQSGQALQIAQNISKQLETEFDIEFAEIEPKIPFPFPWPGISFFQTFPESVQNIPCEIEDLSINPETNFDLIILAFQVWYLSPSIPINSFLQSETAKKLIANKPVITVQGVRNMWVRSQEVIKKRILDLRGNLVGNIVLHDTRPNLISVITIVHWMTKGERYGTGVYKKILPSAGVPEINIKDSSKFGKLIIDSYRKGNLEQLQDKLNDHGAININPVLVNIEKRGFKMFQICSKFILGKGPYGSKKRETRLKIFKYYLFTVIFLISPIASIIFYFIHKLRRKATKKMIDYYSHNLLKE